MRELTRLYLRHCLTERNIDRHLPVLLAYASVSCHVTEFGTEYGASTSAFLMGCLDRLHCYDVKRTAAVDDLERLSEGRLVFHEENTLTCPVIEETDLLFIDTAHTYHQVRTELERHGNQAQKWLIFHDTVACPQILPAIQQFIWQNPHWVLEEHYPQQCGLTVYRRRRS